MTSWIIRAVWATGATVCAIAMYLLPGRETIPFHLIWIGISLVYGFTVWRPVEMVVMVGVTAAVTGAIMVHHASNGWIDWPELAEVPLSVALTAVIAAYLRRRHMALAELAAIAENDRRRSESRQVMVRQVSHELRTPITIARGYTELVRNRIDDETVAEDTAIVLEELDKLAQITQRLVTLIQLDAEYARQPVHLDAELTRVVRRWTPAADRRWSVTCDGGEVLANRDRLEAMLDCLLDNAVRFTEPGDAIRITGTVDETTWTIEIADTGVGLTARDAEALTAAMPTSRQELSGTGLGLVMVRTVVGAWGGSLHFRGRPGAGTIVTLRFPIMRSSADEEIVAEALKNDSSVIDLVAGSGRP
ncbi:signal transduction histidine kinase [Allocatelliglobosispora scoriae]|uniref:histidine kinase n=1 Tax=Allocatelliglobosispora scoriae TaxID=643052 RepID=A0A841BR22_9ACTN|nr:HAMP domain-containing sensor histidine kinase [Allocatelliglobosispora scoriae]MBB5869838.1 signal transduction histidine kinase [Allocatelliglobosispora scoriae]